MERTQSNWNFNLTIKFWVRDRRRTAHFIDRFEIDTLKIRLKYNVLNNNLIHEIQRFTYFPVLIDSYLKRIFIQSNVLLNIFFLLKNFKSKFFVLHFVFTSVMIHVKEPPFRNPRFKHPFLLFWCFGVSALRQITIFLIFLALNSKENRKYSSKHNNKTNLLWTCRPFN